MRAAGQGMRAGLFDFDLAGREENSEASKLAITGPTHRRAGVRCARKKKALVTTQQDEGKQRMRTDGMGCSRRARLTSNDRRRRRPPRRTTSYRITCMSRRQRLLMQRLMLPCVIYIVNHEFVENRSVCIAVLCMFSPKKSIRSIINVTYRVNTINRSVLNLPVWEWSIEVTWRM